MDSGLEVLIPSTETCDWEQNDLRNLHKVKGGNTYIRKIFGRRSGVRRRALHRLRNGHYCIDTLKSAKVNQEQNMERHKTIPGRYVSY